MTNHILTKDQYTQFNKLFTNAANRKSISASDIILNNILRGKDARRGFTEITNETKLGHGMDPWQGYKQAKAQLISSLRWSRTSYVSKFGLDLSNELAEAISQAAREA